MKKILVINASARKERSLSRRLTHLFVEQWQQNYVNDIVIDREVGQGNIPHITENSIAGAFTPPASRTAEQQQALEVSDTLIKELKEADVIVLGTPMYNWSVPSCLKAYLDQILRVNETILIDLANAEDPYKGLLKDKKVYLLLVRGNTGYGPGAFNEHLNFQSNYLKMVFRVMGLEEIEEITLDGSTHGEEALQAALAGASAKIKALIQAS